MPSRSAALFAAACALVVLCVPAYAGDPGTGRQLARQCAGCHGIDGVAKRPDVPHIAGESDIYLRAQLEAFRSGDRHHEQMTIIAQGLEEEEIGHLIAWYSSIGFTVELPDQRAGIGCSPARRRV